MWNGKEKREILIFKDKKIVSQFFLIIIKIDVSVDNDLWKK